MEKREKKKKKAHHRTLLNFDRQPYSNSEMIEYKACLEAVLMQQGKADGPA